MKMAPFTNKPQTIFVGPDDWGKLDRKWSKNVTIVSVVTMGGRDVMIWRGVMGGDIIVSVGVLEGVKSIL